jgi:transposase-like protein
MKHTHTKIKNDNDYLWFWVAIELDNNSILDILSLLAERNMFVAENFIRRKMIIKYGKNPVFIDMVRYMVYGIYSYACRFLKVGHHLHSSF